MLYNAETPVLWPPHAKSWLIGKDSDAGRDWGQEEKGITEDEMAGWHHWLDERASEWTLGVGDGQGGLACCDSWGCKESDTTEWLDWTESPFKAVKTIFFYMKAFIIRYLTRFIQQPNYVSAVEQIFNYMFSFLPIMVTTWLPLIPSTTSSFDNSKSIKGKWQMTIFH